MSEKTEKRRADLRSKIVDAAEQAVLTGGAEAVRARDLAKAAGCALGAIYNVFDDMQDILLEVNSRTYKRMGHAIEAALAAEPDLAPDDRLILLGQTYFRFAADNLTAWRALFDIAMTEEAGVPDWYIEETKRLLHNISGPLALLRPDLPPYELSILCRALFSSVHGIVLLGLERRITAVPEADLGPMISIIIKNFSGMSQIS